MALLVVLLFLLTSTVSSFIVRHSTKYDAIQSRRLIEGSRFGGELSATSTTSSNDQDTTNNNRRWLDQGLLLSSFTDGLKNNEQTQNWIFDAIINTLWMEEQLITQQQLKSSVVASPCNGPDPNLLTQLEHVDNAMSDRDGSTTSKSWKTSWKMLCKTKQNRILSTLPADESPPEIEIRVVFIPTASYALRSDSTATPGKQRQRARADGKKRRNEMVQLLLQGFESADDDLDSTQQPNVSILAVTLDLDDGSIKQPEASSSSSSARGASTDPSFPMSGEEAIGQWAPHLIYVQGGNTFWLYHCMEKGKWKNKIFDACSTRTGKNNQCDERTNIDDSSYSERFSSIYCGVSAGAIVVGQSMQTACWKEWDDPSVVPGRETYNDWKDIRGLDLVGGTSFFPHMDDRWKPLVDQRRKELPVNLRHEHDDDVDDQSIHESNVDFDVCCLTDFDACTVNGKERSINVISNILSLL